MLLIEGASTVRSLESVRRDRSESSDDGFAKLLNGGDTVSARAGFLGGGLGVRSAVPPGLSPFTDCLVTGEAMTESLGRWARELHAEVRRALDQAGLDTDCQYKFRVTTDGKVLGDDPDPVGSAVTDAFASDAELTRRFRAFTEDCDQMARIEAAAHGAMLDSDPMIQRSAPEAGRILAEGQTEEAAARRGEMTYCPDALESDAIAVVGRIAINGVLYGLPSFQVGDTPPRWEDPDLPPYPAGRFKSMT